MFPSSAESPSAWLDALNLGKYKPHFERAGIVEVTQIHSLTQESLQAAGISLVGHRTRMLQAAKALVPLQTVAPTASEVSDQGQVKSIPSELGSRLGAMDIDDDEGSEACRPRDRSLNFGLPVGVAPPAKRGPDGKPAANEPPIADVGRRANSTSSIYITSTLQEPDAEELIFCIAVVIHERIAQSEQLSYAERHRFPFFSEDTNPIYAYQEFDGRGNDSESGSDSEQKRESRRQR